MVIDLVLGKFLKEIHKLDVSFFIGLHSAGKNFNGAKQRERTKLIAINRR